MDITPRPPMIELPAVPLDQALDYLSQACEQVAATPPQLQQHLILQGSMLTVETTIAALYARVAELEAAQTNGESNGYHPDDVAALAGDLPRPM